MDGEEPCPIKDHYLPQEKDIIPVSSQERSVVTRARIPWSRLPGQGVLSEFRSARSFFSLPAASQWTA